MAWSAPLTAVSNATLTAAQWNASVRDNLNMTAPALATTPGSMFVTTAANTIAERIPTANYIGTTETTTSTTYTALTTAGPTVTVTTASRMLSLVSCEMFNNTAGAISWMAHEVSGATTLAASDTWGLKHGDTGAAGTMCASRSHLEVALTPGSQTVTLKYRVTAGTGTFQRRQVIVMPF